MTHQITTQKALRAAFWEENEDLKRRPWLDAERLPVRYPCQMGGICGCAGPDGSHQRSLGRPGNPLGK